ncbi:MAG: autotransporter-associated beta strand repeat-containing protein [Chthoniobacterales bacterium]
MSKNLFSTARFPSILAGSIATLLLSHSAQSAARTWVGNTPPPDWVTNANWNGGTVLATGDSITFNAAGTQGASLTNTLTNSGFNIAGITFSATAPAYTQSGNTFNLTAGITNSSNFLQTFNNTGGLTNSASSTFAVSAAGGTTITNGLTDTSNANQTTTVNGAGGTLTLGSFTINSGAATTTATLSGTGNINIAGAVTNGGAGANGVTISNATANTAVVTFGGTNTYTGLTSVGTTNGVNGSLVTTTGNLVISGNQTAATGGLYVAGNSTLDIRSTTALGAGPLTIGASFSAATVLNGSGSALIETNNAPIVLTTAIFGAARDTGGNGDINFGAGTLSYSGVFNNLLLGAGSTFRFDGAASNTAGNAGVGIYGAGNTLVFGSSLTLSTTTGTGTTFNGAGNVSFLGTAQNGAGTSSLGWSSTGILTMAGANTYTGTTSFNSGTVNLDYTGNAGTKISGTATGGNLTLGGSVILNLNGGSTTETVNNWTLNAGANAINRTGGSTGKIVAAGLTRNAGSTLALGAGGVLSTTTGSANTLFTTTAGVVGVVGGDDWAAKDSSNLNIVGLSTTTSTYTNSTGSTVAGNTDVVTNVAGTTLSASTLRFNTANARTIDATGGSLTLTQGGVLVTPAVGNNLTTITGGTLTAGATNKTLMVFQNNTANGLTIGSTIADNGANVVTFVKSGAGLLTLSNTSNTYTGKTYLNQGITNIAAETSLGATPGALVADQLTMAGGTLQFGANNISLSANRGVTLIGAGNTIDTNGNDATISGIIAGSGFGLTKTGAGTLFLTAANSFSGPFTIKAGVVNATTFAGTNANSSFGRGGTIAFAGDLVLDGGLLQYTGATAVSTIRQYTLTTNGGGFDASGTSTGGVTFSGAMTASGSSGTQALTLTGTGTGTAAGTLSGTINNGSGSNVTSLLKTGTGTWNVSGANTYTGTTSVQNGTLAVGATGAISNTLILGVSGGTTGILDVSAKASFSEANISGSGTMIIGAGKTITATGNVAPGFSPGALNVTGNFTLASTAATTLEIGGTTAGTTFDVINTSGILNYGGTLTLTSFGGYNLTQTGSYNLFTAGTFSNTTDFSSVAVSGTFLSNSGGVWTGSDGAANYTFTDANGVLAVTAVPEPGTYAMIGMGAGLLWFVQRRRRAV